MEQLKLLLNKWISKEWIERYLWLSTYNQNKLLSGQEVKRFTKRNFNDNMKEFIDELESAHFEDVL